eukprot:4837690-Prymnesium_polylepis.1
MCTVPFTITHTRPHRLRDDCKTTGLGPPGPNGPRKAVAARPSTRSRRRTPTGKSARRSASALRRHRWRRHRRRVAPWHHSRSMTTKSSEQVCKLRERVAACLERARAGGHL